MITKAERLSFVEAWLRSELTFMKFSEGSWIDLDVDLFGRGFSIMVGHLLLSPKVRQLVT
jgi:hypothetical protein